MEKEKQTARKIVIPILIVIILLLTVVHNTSTDKLESEISVANENIESLNEELEYYKSISSEDYKGYELLNCPLCGYEDVNLNPINESFYIECPEGHSYNNDNGCGLTTDYFDNKNELIEYWNTRFIE